jgi:hypothetical protein
MDPIRRRDGQKLSLETLSCRLVARLGATCRTMAFGKTWV